MISLLQKSGILKPNPEPSNNPTELSATTLGMMNYWCPANPAQSKLHSCFHPCEAILLKAQISPEEGLVQALLNFSR